MKEGNFYKEGMITIHPEYDKYSLLRINQRLMYHWLILVKIMQFQEGRKFFTLTEKNGNLTNYLETCI